MKTSIELIAAERQRQIEVEKYDTNHDAYYGHGELVGAAMCYAAESVNKHYPKDAPKLRAQVFVPGVYTGFFVNPETGTKDYDKWEDAWPWDDQYDKRDKHAEIRCLVISCALLVAQIEKRLKETTLNNL